MISGGGIKMDITKLKNILEKRLARDGWQFDYNSEEQQLRIENEIRKGVTLSLPSILTNDIEQQEKAIEEAVRYVEIALIAMKQDIHLKGKEKQIYPVIRSTSFPLETKDGRKLVYDKHTGETNIFYSVDVGSYYTLLDEGTILEAGYSVKQIKELALFNIRSLAHSIKEDKVAGNSFYFIHTNDGYDASRVLNVSLLEKMNKQVKGKLAVAVPHQDVLIFADITNDTGYDVLAQMVFQFYSQGKVPITALPFLYEDGELEPVFILAQRKPRQ